MSWPSTSTKPGSFDGMAKLMVMGTEGALLASSRAWRSEPAPLSAVLVTVSVRDAGGESNSGAVDVTVAGTVWVSVLEVLW